jgi:selenium-binding protein 1
MKTTRFIKHCALAGVLAAVAAAPAAPQAHHTNGPKYKEKFIYVVATDGSGDNPDFLAPIGTDPDEKDKYGRIFARLDMPNVDDELHHFGYSLDQDRLIIPGLFSNRIHVVDLTPNPKKPQLAAVYEDLIADSGYIVPHTVIAMPDNRVMVTMIGAYSETTGPGGVVLLDDRSGEFAGYFGPGPEHTIYAQPKYMYDFGVNEDDNVAVSTTFGWPADVGAGINPLGFGDEITFWDFAGQTPMQPPASLGAFCGALEVRWLEGRNMGMTNCPGTDTVWLWEDEDQDGSYAFHPILSAEDGLNGPVDMVLAGNDAVLYLTNWFASTLQAFDIRDPYAPVLIDQVAVPHANMLRVSVDGKRIYVSNELVTTWDNDINFGGPRNDHYGIWLFHRQDDGTLVSETADGSAWVDFTDVQMKNSRGPAGPHQMFFDPSVAMAFGHH